MIREVRYNFHITEKTERQMRKIHMDIEIPIRTIVK